MAKTGGRNDVFGNLPEDDEDDELEDLEDDEDLDDEDEEDDDDEEDEEDDDSEEDEDEEDEEQEDKPLKDRMLSGKSKLAGVFDSVEQLERGYKELQSYSDRRFKSGHDILIGQGYTFDKKTGRYLPPEEDAEEPQTRRVGTRTPQAADASEGKASPKPLKSLNHAILDKEAKTGKFGIGENKWPLDRYGNEVVDDEAWEELAEKEGWSEAKLERAINRYHRTLETARETAWKEERATFESQLRTWEASQETEAKKFVKEFPEKFPLLPPAQSAKVAEFFVNRAKKVLREAADNGEIDEADALRPGHLRQTASILLSQAIDNREFTKIAARFEGAKDRPARAKSTSDGSRTGKVVRTRLVTPGEDDADVDLEDAPSTPSSRNGTKGSKVLDSLPARAKRSVNYVAETLGIPADKLAEESVKNGRFRRRR